MIYIYIILFLFSINQVRSEDISHPKFPFKTNNAFIENKGQCAEEVKYYSLNPLLNIWICDAYLLLDYYKFSEDERIGERIKLNLNWQSEPTYSITNPNNYKVNYFKGRYSYQWIKNINSSQSVIISDNSGNQIVIEMEDKHFNLKINSISSIDNFISNDNYDISSGSYQLKFESQLDIIESENKYPFPQNDNSLIYSSYLGGTGWDSGQDLAVDKKGNIYITGYTNSENFPTTIGAYSEKLRKSKHNEPDVFISKFDSTGQNLIFSTYIGSQMEDFGKSIAVDDSFNIFVTGTTGPTETFPVTSNAYDTTQNGAFDLFLVKLNPNGDSLIYSTYIGSSNDDYGQSLYVDSKGNAHITGYTMYNTDFPITNQAIQDFHGGKNDVFYCRMNSQGNDLLVSTFIGGEDDDFGESIHVGSNGLVYIVGSTRSQFFPVTGNAVDKTYNDTTTATSRSDAFLTILHESGLYINYSTYLGGSGRDVAYSLALDKDRSIYVTGITESKDFPITSYAYDTTYRSVEGEKHAGDIFVTKLIPNGSDIVYSTYIGGSSADKAYDIKISQDYYAFIIGSTSSFDMPVSKNAFDKTYNDSTFGADVLIAALDYSGHNLVYSSYFGGIAHEISYSLQLINDETLYFVGTTSSKDFPVSHTAFSSTYSNDRQSDVFFSILTPKIIAVSAGGDKEGILRTCKNELVKLGSDALGTRGSTTYTWFPSDGLNRTDIAQPLLLVTAPATYFVHVIDEKGNEDRDTVHIELMPYIKAEIYGPQYVFKNSRHTYGTLKNDFAKYKWFAEGGTILSSDTTNSISVKWGAGPFGYLTLATMNDIGCTDTLKSFIISIGDIFIPKIIPLGKTTFCDGDTCILDAGEGFVSYLWSDGKGSRYDTVLKSGNYWVFVKDTLGYQAISDTIKITVLPSPEKPLIHFNGTMLSCNIVTGYYQWYHDGVKIPGANQRTYKPIMIGLYKCEIGWTTNSCTSFSDTLRLNFDNAVDDNLKKEFKIYPNPADETIFININKYLYSDVSVKIIDIIGTVIMNKEVNLYNNNGIIEIKTNKIPNGIYLVNILTPHDLFYSKLIIYR